MPISVPNPKFSSHARSISLPSTSHPLIANAEEHLQRLKLSETVQSSSSHTFICQKLGGLHYLYECLDDVLQLHLSQRVISHERCNKWVEEVLDGSLRLLDICGAVRDIYSQKQESIQELESSLRRKRGGELVSGVETYMASKKNLNKMICKCYKGLKRAEKKCSLAVLEKNFDTVITLVNLIKQVQEVSLKVLESTLSFVSQSKVGSEPKGWSLVSKVLQHKRESLKDDSDIDAIEKIEVELQLLNDKKSNKDGDVVQMQNILKRLEALNLSIQEVEQVLEIVYRILLKTRASLLNILNY